MSVVAKLAAFWSEMQPQVAYNYDAGGAERWDGLGVGPLRNIRFEGFGLSLSLYFGRMPKKRGAEADRQHRT